MDEWNEESLFKEFIEEALDLVESAEEPLLSIESHPDGQAEAINIIFRAYHSVKGGAGMLDLNEFVNLAHTLENKLDHYRKTGDLIPPDDYEYFLAGTDLIKHILQELLLMCNRNEEVSCKGFVGEIDNFLGASTKNDAVVLENLEDFKIEAKENLDIIEASLLELEAGGDKDVLDEIFRCAHSVKGASDYAGGKLVTRLAHTFESVLDNMRKESQFSFSQNLVDVLLEVNDTLKDIVFHCEDQSYRAEEVNDLIKKLQNDFLNGEEDLTNLKTKEEVFQYREILKQQLEIFDQFAQQFFKTNSLKSMKGIRRTTKNIAAAARFQNDEELDEISKTLGVLLGCDDILELDQNLLRKEIEDYYNLLCKKSGSLEGIEENKPDNIQSINEKKEPVQTSTAPSTLKIGQDIADNFTNLVGELIVAKNSLFHMVENLKKSEGQINSDILSESNKISNSIAQLTNELNYNVMKMRMVPVKHIFSKFPRLIRDLSKKVNKKVKLEIFGEDTEIDKAIAESLFDPLVHMIRNSLDHGIESAQLRSERGKDEEATVSLKAIHEGSSIIIEISDDGGGVNKQKVLALAIEKGIVDEASAAHLSHDEIISLIMAPGFSTADKVTDLSGRGVGMDVVKNNIEKLKGRVHLSSTEEVGTCFRLELPLTMAISEVLIVEAVSQVYALPIENILEIVKISSDRFHPVMGEKTISLRGEVISLVWMHEVMYPDDELFQANKDIIRDTTILILEIGNKKIGLCVDRIVRKQEIVIKPLPSIYGGSEILSGTSILGDGQSVLIVETNNIINVVTKTKESKQISLVV